MTASHDRNRRAWDARARKGERFTEPARREDLNKPLSAIDPCGWLSEGVQGKRLLCLAAGGGRHGALYAAAGAVVTVVDLSAEMLAIDRQVAAESGRDVRTVQASMDNLSMLPTGGFDIVIHPVSTCYLPDVRPVYREVARVLVPGGIYISQHKQPASMQADTRPSQRGYELVEAYYRVGPLPAVSGSLHREDGTLEFLHRWEELVGEMCRAGFVIEDLLEPCHANREAAFGDFRHRSQYVPPYVRIKARRTDERAAAAPCGILIQ
jgi:SAM-dependent methyltransferase